MIADRRRRVFLSASVPLPSRDPVYFQTADVVAIRDAIRALIMVTVESQLQLVFGGHPAITPMIRLQLSQLATAAGNRIVLFQSRFFSTEAASRDDEYLNIHWVEGVPNDREASLKRMRERMLGGRFIAGIFVGGMDGVETEYRMFTKAHRGVPAFPVASTGAAAALLFERDKSLKRRFPALKDELSYLSLMRSLLKAPRPPQP
jgi:SLOG cluster3 family